MAAHTAFHANPGATAGLPTAGRGPLVESRRAAPHRTAQPRDFREYLEALRRNKLAAFLASLLVFAISMATVLLLPPVYTSSATILIQQQEIPQELVRSTVTVFAEQRIQIITQRVMTTANLLEVIKKFGLYEREREKQTLDAVVERMRDDINFETISAEVVDPRNGRPVRATLAFTVAYDNPTPVIAQRVANELASLYLNENLKSRRELAAETSSFLADEATKLSDQVRDLEQQLAVFKEENAGKLPELTSLNMQIIERLDRELLELERQMRSQQQSRIFLTAQLVGLKPTIDEAGGNSQALRVQRSAPGQGYSRQFVDAEKELEAMQTEFSALTGRYGEDHPDVIRMKREMRALRQQVGGRAAGGTVLSGALEQAEADLSAAEQRYSAEHPDVKRLRRRVASLTEEVAEERSVARQSGSASSGDIPNPAYIEIKARLEAGEADIASLESKRDEIKAKLESYELRLVETPQVEREYRNLTRNYENTLAKFQEIKAKQLEAQLAEQLETEQKGERFTLIEPPQLPELPTAPNRPLLAGLGTVLAIAAGVGMALIMDVLDGKVRGARMLTEIAGVPPLATIPFIDTPGDRRGRWGWRLLVLLLILTTAAAGAFAVHTYVAPLDVLWFSFVNRLPI